MTDEHEHTEQEQTLYDHMHAGEWDQIEHLRAEAYAAPIPERRTASRWPPPPSSSTTTTPTRTRTTRPTTNRREEEREENTREQTEGENAVAAEAEEAL